jgi:hypothetical protein
MRCERCHGLGRVLMRNSGGAGAPREFDVALCMSPDGAGIEVACPECNGSGIAHCCDGLRAHASPVGTDIANGPTR